MWRRSASFILDKNQNDVVTNPESRHLSPLSSSMAEALQHQQQPNPNPDISAYYQTRAAHHGVVTSDWLAQAQAAVDHPTEDAVSANYSSTSGDLGKKFCVIDEFNSWRKQPDLAEAVAAIRALASVIRSSEATTMMELEIELKKASDSLKGSNCGKGTAATNNDIEGAVDVGGDDLLGIPSDNEGNDDYGGDEESGSSTLYSN